MTTKRDRLAAFAADIVKMISKRMLGSKRAPKDVHLVVVVTDVNGEWVGVSSNVNPVRTASILKAALGAADRRQAPRGVIDASGEEA